MKRVVALVDGFNLYYSIDRSFDGQLKKYKWLNLRSLLERYVFKQDENLEKVLYFTALTNDNNKRARHLTYINALRGADVKTVTRYIRHDPIMCEKCGAIFKRPIEKQTDANIISSVLTMTALDEFDVFLIVSGDSDLVPMIKAAKRIDPSKKFRLIVPFNQKVKELTSVCDDRRKIKKEHIEHSQFPQTIKLDDGTIIEKPKEWL